MQSPASARIETALGVRVTVNGLPAEPISTPYQVEHVGKTSFVERTLTGVRYVDIDAAEAASPGTFVNVPLDIEFGANVGTGTTTGDVSLRARLTKK